MNELGLDREQIERIILPNLLLIAFGGKTEHEKKIIIKYHRRGERKHVTLSISGEGYMDIHETLELEPKIHKPIARIKIEDFAKTIQQNYSDISRFKIDINDRRYRPYNVLVPKYPDGDKLLIESLSTSNRRTVILHFKEFDSRRISQFFRHIKFSQIQRYNFQRAYAYNPKNRSGIIIILAKGEYYGFSSEDIRHFREIAETILASTTEMACQNQSCKPLQDLLG